MRRCLPVLACAALLWSADLRAETFEEGLRAFRAGQPERALSIWQPLANDGHAAAQYSLGKLFEQGEGPSRQDFGKAVQWFEAAAKRLGLNRSQTERRTDLFKPPPRPGGQLELF